MKLCFSSMGRFGLRKACSRDSSLGSVCCRSSKAAPKNPKTQHRRRFGSLLYAQGVPRDSPAPYRDVADLKGEVLRAVAQQQRADREEAFGAKQRVLEAVQTLEETGTGLCAPVTGRWTLVYSTQQAAQEVKASWDNEALQAATNGLYKAFFRFAPALAGSQETGGSSSVRNEQIVDLEAGEVDNVVEIRLPWAPETALRVRVWGEVQAAAADAGAPPEAELVVTFTGWGFSLAGPGQEDSGRELKLPLPRPRGTLRVTFCDDTLRISRGGRGGLFVTSRAPSM